MASEDFAHFKDLVAGGDGPGCSSGEAAALALARAIVQHFPVLDHSASLGFMDFVYWSVDRYEECRDWLATHGGVEF